MLMSLQESQLLNKEDIEKYLRMLGKELQQRNITGLRVYFPSLDYLFAMKVVAGRPQDVEDIKALAHELKLSNTQESLVLVKKYVPEQLLVPRIEYMIDEIFE
jgi:hypothetical protein